MRFPPIVLLIEDSPDQLDLYEIALRDVYDVRRAPRGDIGVRLALDDPPDAVLCDLQMPGMDGLDVCRRLKGDPRTAAVPVIILTALDDEDLPAKATGAGAAALLTKPCSIDTLRASIRSRLSAAER